MLPLSLTFPRAEQVNERKILDDDDNDVIT